MTIGGQQSRPYDKSCPAYACPKTLAPDFARDVIDAIDIGYRFARIVHRGHGKRLLILKVLNLPGQFMYLPCQVRVLGLCGRIVVRHHQGAREREHAQQPLYKALPGLDDFDVLILRIGHGASGPKRGRLRGSHYPDAIRHLRVGY